MPTRWAPRGGGGENQSWAEGKQTWRGWRLSTLPVAPNRRSRDRRPGPYQWTGGAISGRDSAARTRARLYSSSWCMAANSTTCSVLVPM